MPQISIGDITGSTQIDVSDTALLGKNPLSRLTAAVEGFVAALPNPVTGTTFQDAKFAATFENPSIALEGNTVDVKASVNSIISVARGANTDLFGAGDYDPVALMGNDCWVSFELDTLLDASIAVPLPNGFGVSFEASTAPTFATYLLIPDAQAPATTLKDAISKTLSCFTILASSADVMAIPQGAIYTNDVSGTIKVGGSWSLPLTVNQLSLADANLPFNSSAAVSPALTLGVSGDIELTCEFNVRFRRSAANQLRIGLYKVGGTTFDASFTASAGLGANRGNTDLIDAFFTAVSPGIDLSNLSPGDASNIRSVVNESINRSLSISLNAACSASLSDEAAVLYEVDISGQDQATKDAIDGALRGDWTTLSTLPNAKKLKNVITDTVETKLSVTVNLLGLYNYESLSDFVRSMKVLRSLDDGSIVITDTTTASRIAAASTPLAADTDRLLAALYESFIATATYKALAFGIGTNPAFQAAQAYFVYKDSMDYRSALKQLNPGLALGVEPVTLKAGLRVSGNLVHHARFAGSCSYGNDHVLRFFFSDIQAFTPRTVSDLTKTGRKVLASLLDPQDPTDNHRIAALLDDQAWAAMDANPAKILRPYYSDWVDITEWASAIAKVGPLLADTIRFAKTLGGDPTMNPTFMKKRATLALALDGATHNTHAAFDPAFAICVMATLAGLIPGPNPPPPIFEAGWDGLVVFSNKPQTSVAKTASAAK